MSANAGHGAPQGTPRGRTANWIERRLPVFSTMEHFSQYPTPKNLNYWWNFGSIAGFVLVAMIVTGIVLAMHYTPHVDHAFNSVERIMRDVNYGWLIRYLHANGGAMFFLVVYIHLFRGLYYGSYKAPREIIWWLGIIILLLMMATAFMGYVLPWGQMSFWAAKVITNLFSAIPWVGESITTWLWGGFTVDNPTLNRFFSLHYLLPFVIVGVVVLHIAALHTVKSGNPLGVEAKTPKDTIPFHPYYTVKDLFGLGVFMLVWAFFVFYAPNFMGHPDNYIPADSLATPAHIVPEWYFLPYYAILRAFTADFFMYWPISWLITAKFAGVIAMFGSLLILFLMPWLDTSEVRSSRFRPIYKIFFWVFVIDTIILGYVGANAPDEVAHIALLGLFDFSTGLTWLTIGEITTFWYFFHFIILVPVIGRMERPRPLPHSISEPVLGGGAVGGGAAAQSRPGPMEKA